jgi:hypothetical protein
MILWDYFAGSAIRIYFFIIHCCTANVMTAGYRDKTLKRKKSIITVVAR